MFLLRELVVVVVMMMMVVTMKGVLCCFTPLDALSRGCICACVCVCVDALQLVAQVLQGVKSMQTNSQHTT